MIVSHINKVVAGTKTERKSEVSNIKNWDTIERCVFADRLTKNDQQSASIILDLIEQKTLKNRLEEMSEIVFVKYTERYSEDISEALKTWVRKDSRNLQKLLELKLEEEMDKEETE